MALASSHDLVQALLNLPLLEAGRNRELAALAAEHGDPKSLAKVLLERGWLTAFQVNALFQNGGRDLVLGPYVLLERVGQGGMGQVFKARHVVMNRVVALKVIRDERLETQEAVRRFRREIQAAAQLAHPNIVLAHDAGEVGGRHYLVMELIDGQDLGRLVQRQGPLATAQACELVRQAALGLQHAHERGLIHRDIKPSNLLLSREGVVKVLDLGLALLRAEAPGAATHLTETGTVMGTPDFLAPEQAIDPRQADARADVYSLGCTLYFLLAGRTPFPQSTLAQKLLWQQQAEPAALGTVRGEVPAELTAVVRRMMAKKPEERFSTMREVADALTPFAGKEPVPGVGATTVDYAPGGSWSVAPATTQEGGSGVATAAARPAPSTLTAGDLPTALPYVPRPSPAGRSSPLMIYGGIGGGIGLACLVVLLVWRPWSSGEADRVEEKPIAAAGLKTKGEDERPKAEEKKKSEEGKQPNPVPVEKEPLPKEGPWPRGGQAITLHLKTKLGVEVKTEIRSATSSDRNEPLERFATYYRSGRTRVPCLALDLSGGNFVLIPWQVVRRGEAGKGGHVVQLIDGSSRFGKILTTIRDDQGKAYVLDSTTEFHRPGVAAAQPPKRKGQTFALHFNGPGGIRQTVHVQHPQFLTTAHTFSDSFTIDLGGENLQGNLSDFQQAQMKKGGKEWRFAVRTPGGVEKEGAFVMQFGWWWLYAEAANECVYVLSNSKTSDGFLLETQR